MKNLQQATTGDNIRMEIDAATSGGEVVYT